MNKQNRRISNIATPMLIACGLLFSGESARADSRSDAACSNRTLSGDYGSAVEGVVLPAPGVFVPIRGVVITHYDGAGHFTQADHIVINGVAPTLAWTPGTGTYHINSDCTGTAHISVSTGGFVNLALVVVKQGKQVHAVVTAPFDGPARTVASVMTKVE